MTTLVSLCLSAALATDAPAVLDADTTWSLADSPIRVEDEVLVE